MTVAVICRMKVLPRRVNGRERAHHRGTGGEMTKRICTIEGCDRFVVGIGLCSMHWQRRKRHGDPGPAAPHRIHGDLAAVFLSRTEVDRLTGCWRWTGALHGGGYGHLRYQGHDHISHVLAYTLIVGPIPEGLTIDHECHNRDAGCPGGECSHRACWNPAHLVPRTMGDNRRRGRRGGPKRTATCRKCGASDWYVSPQTGARYCRPCKRRKEMVGR